MFLLHFTYTPSLARFGSKFHQVWQEIFEETPLSDIPVIFAYRLTDNLKSILVHKKPSKHLIKNIIEKFRRIRNESLENRYSLLPFSIYIIDSRLQTNE